MLEAFGLSDPGCVRSNNEDYYVLASPLDLFIVADGMGGALAGEHASKLAGDTVAEHIWQAGQTNGETLLNAFREANRRVLAEAETDAAFQGMGTTLVAGWKVGAELLVASVGDSRAYVYQDDELHVITEDQTWVNEVGRKLGISEEALRAHPMRHVLTMAIGVSDTLRIHSYAVPLKDNALFLFCSDGLHGVLDSGTIADALAEDGSLDSKCHKLIEAARQAGGPDNITAVLVRSQNGA
ncbi:MAG TPA: protein phosphatase 2C domain-containing protein [Bryobacteraceae bacterium]|nr:protein phosphatase 2C domain-containing protein [Bryobacteraceae bacterium]